MNPTRAYIALGSNLGDRLAIMESAFTMLEESRGISVAARSSIHETEPIGPPGQGAYLNAAAALETNLAPHALLDMLLEIERLHGRDRTATVRWGPRTLDLDLLLYGNALIEEPGLRIPHPHLHERGFVLLPLNEIAPELRHPVTGQTVAEMLAALQRGAPHQAERRPL